MVHALGVARDFFADYAVGIGVAARAAHATDSVSINDFHIERAGAGAVMGADGGHNAQRGIHLQSCRQNPSGYSSTSPPPCAPANVVAILWISRNSKNLTNWWGSFWSES